MQVKDVAESLDVHPFMLSMWRKEVRDGVLTAEGEAIIEPRSSTELRRLRQLEKEKQEHELQRPREFCADQTGVANGTGTFQVPVPN